MESLTFPNPIRQRPSDLGPKQLAWASKFIPGFKANKRDADRAQKHAEKVKAKVLV